MSGGAPLDRRPGLASAVALIEAGEADVVVVAYFDRLVRRSRCSAKSSSASSRRGGDPRGRRRRGARGHGVRWLSSTMLGWSPSITAA